MKTQKIKCRACGFGALLFTAGESTRVTVDSAKQIHLCNYLREQPKSRTASPRALDCRDFREAIQRPGKNDDSDSSTLDAPENEGVTADAAAPEKASVENPSQSRRLRQAEAADTHAGSPKPKPTRRARNKSASTRARKTHSDVPIVADGEPRVS
jgi:hypothetical protein